MDALVNEDSFLWKHSNFEHGFRPAYYFSRFAGLWPFSIIHHSNRPILRARIGFFDGLWFILSICLKLTLAFYAYEILKTGREKHTNRIIFIVDNMCDISCCLFGVIATVLDMINRNKLVDILQKFNAFDDEVRFLYTIFFFNSNWIYIWHFSWKKTDIKNGHSFQLQALLATILDIFHDSNIHNSIFSEFWRVYLWPRLSFGVDK